MQSLIALWSVLASESRHHAGGFPAVGQGVAPVFGEGEANNVAGSPDGDHATLTTWRRERKVANPPFGG